MEQNGYQAIVISRRHYNGSINDTIITVTVRYTSNGVTRESAIVRNIGDFVVSGSIEASKRYVFRLKFTPFGEMALTCVVQDWNQETIDVPDFD